MTKEDKTEKEKKSLIKKFILLILIPVTVAVTITVINTFMPNFLGLNPKRELITAKGDSVSLINGDLPKQISSNYSLTDRPSKKIKSFFLKTIIVKNNGNKGVENLPISICLKGKNIFLIDNPEIKTKPKEIIDAITIQKTPDSTNIKHIWNVSLLNPGEYVQFLYTIYSEEKVKDFQVNVLARKKDWKVIKGIISDSTSPKRTWLEVVVIISGTFTIALIVAGMFGVLIFIVLEYIMKTKKKGKEALIKTQ